MTKDNTATLPTIWVLADERVGNVNQCLGVAEALGFPFIRKNIVYNAFSSLPNWLQGASMIGIDRQKSDPLTAPYPDIIIAAGRRTVPLARYIKKQTGGKCFITQLMWPGFPIDGLDLIAIPGHDTPPALPADSKSTVITTVGAAHRVTPERLTTEHTKWAEKFSDFPTPRTAVLIGGTTKDNKFTINHMHQFGEQISQLAKTANGSLLVSTSRRTDKDMVVALRESITAPCYFHEWTPEGENPYFGFLANSDAIIATGDSMSMCSEACATGKPVYIFSPGDITSVKHQRLHEQLYRLGFAKAFNGTAEAPWEYTPLFVAQDIAHAIKEQLQIKAAKA